MGDSRQKTPRSPSADDIFTPRAKKYRFWLKQKEGGISAFEPPTNQAQANQTPASQEEDQVATDRAEAAQRDKEEISRLEQELADAEKRYADQANKERELEEELTALTAEDQREAEVERVCKDRGWILSDDRKEVIPREVAEFKELHREVEFHQVRVYYESPDVNEHFHSDYGFAMNLAENWLRHNDGTLWSDVHDNYRTRLEGLAAMTPPEVSALAPPDVSALTLPTDDSPL